MPETTEERTAGEEAAPGARGFSPVRLVPLALICVGFGLFFAFGLDRYLSFEMLSQHRDTIVAWCNDNAGLAAAGFVLMYCVATAFSLPGALWITIAGGFVFGAPAATLYVVIGATLGATAIFLAARYALADVLRAKAGPALRKMEDGFQANALSYLLVLRLVPLFPFWLVNLVPAFLGVPVRIFVIGTFFGIIPGTFVYAWVGSGVGTVFEAGGKPDLDIIFEPNVFGPLLGLAVLSLIPIAYKRFKGRQAAS